MSKTNNKFKSFVDSAQNDRPKKSKAWDSLPEQAHKDIAEACEINDSGGSITVETMLKWLRTEYGWDYSETTLRRYVKEVLNRTSWNIK